MIVKIVTYIRNCKNTVQIYVIKLWRIICDSLDFIIIKITSYVFTHSRLK